MIERPQARIPCVSPFVSCRNTFCRCARRVPRPTFTGVHSPKPVSPSSTTDLHRSEPRITDGSFLPVIGPLGRMSDRFIPNQTLARYSQTCLRQQKIRPAMTETGSTAWLWPLPSNSPHVLSSYVSYFLRCISGRTGTPHTAGRWR